MVVKEASATETAMMIQFWQVGYNQTTIDDLITVGQLSRTQFYRQYHNKRVALRRCLEQYQSTLAEQLDQLIQRERARQTPLPALIAACLRLPFQSDRWPAGCLMVNLMAEIGPQDAALMAQLQTIYANLQTRFVGLLSPQAQTLPTTVAETAASLMQVRSGIQLLAKQDPSGAQLKQQAQTSVNLIMGVVQNGRD